MANIKSAKKRAVQSESRRKHNIALKSAYRTYVKKVESAILSNNKDETAKSLKSAIKVIDKVAAKGIIHKNTAARCKSRLSSKAKK